MFSHRKIFLFMTLAPMLCIAFGAQAQKAREQVLYSFTGGDDGGIPQSAGVVRDGKGNLYGTTFTHGADGHGAVYKLAPDGRETTLYTFTGGADGGNPYAGVIRDKKGNLYGTALNGGGACKCGTVFEIAPDGSEMTLHTFAGGKDGTFPASALLMDNKGDLYGTTTQGGGSGKCDGGCGTVFRLTSKGKETVLYAFGYKDGAYPYAQPVIGEDGTLYGTASGGGIGCMAGCGVVFALSPNGKQTVLHRFSGGGDGALPYAGLVMDNTGTLYGAAGGGGDPNCLCGVAFSITSQGKETVLHAFKGGRDGNLPNGLPALDAAGNVYGATFFGGGACNCGAVYEVSAMGQESIRYRFAAGNDGSSPVAGLIIDKKGNLYGTTDSGGVDGDGTVYMVK